MELTGGGGGTLAVLPVAERALAKLGLCLLLGFGAAGAKRHCSTQGAGLCQLVDARAAARPLAVHQSTSQPISAG